MSEREEMNNQRLQRPKIKRYNKFENLQNLIYQGKSQPQHDPLAQLAEHLTFNQGVPRSSRGWVTSLRESMDKPFVYQGLVHRFFF